MNLTLFLLLSYTEQTYSSYATDTRMEMFVRLTAEKLLLSYWRVLIAVTVKMKTLHDADDGEDFVFVPKD